MVDTSAWNKNLSPVNHTLVSRSDRESFLTDTSVSLWLAADIWFSFGVLTMLTSRRLVKCKNPENDSLLCEDRLQRFSL